MPDHVEKAGSDKPERGIFSGWRATALLGWESILFLETAGAFGLRVRPKVTTGADLAMTIDFDPHLAPIDRIIDAWLPLTFAVNSINRSMGIPDLYPFVLPPAVIVKLSFIHAKTHVLASSHFDDPRRGALRAVIARLKRDVGMPELN